MIYIIIVNYNNFLFTNSCVKSILNSSFKNFKIIIVDNNSTDDSIKKIKDLKNKLSKSVSLISMEKNGGYAFGINNGIKFAINNSDCKYLFLLNNDTVIETECLKELIDNYKSNTIVSPVIYDYENKKNVQSYGGKLNKYLLTTSNIKIYDPLNINYLPGTALFLEKEIIKILGFLPEEYFMYYEDVDWSTKALINNLSLVVNKKSIIYHRIKNKLPFYLKLRSNFNRLIYSFKYYKYKLPLIIIVFTLSFFKSILIYPVKNK